MLLHSDVVPHAHEALSMPAMIAIGVVAFSIAAVAVTSILRKSK